MQIKFFPINYNIFIFKGRIVARIFLRKVLILGIYVVPAAHQRRIEAGVHHPGGKAPRNFLKLQSRCTESITKALFYLKNSKFKIVM